MSIKPKTDTGKIHRTFKNLFLPLSHFQLDLLSLSVYIYIYLYINIDNKLTLFRKEKKENPS